MRFIKKDANITPSNLKEFVDRMFEKCKINFTAHFGDRLNNT